MYIIGKNEVYKVSDADDILLSDATASLIRILENNKSLI